MANVGSTDRMIRLILGVVLLAVGLLPLAGIPVIAGLGNWHWAVAAVGAVLVLTGTVRVCPAYSLLGISTRGRTTATR